VNPGGLGQSGKYKNFDVVNELEEREEGWRGGGFWGFLIERTVSNASLSHPGIPLMKIQGALGIRCIQDSVLGLRITPLRLYVFSAENAICAQGTVEGLRGRREQGAERPCNYPMDCSGTRKSSRILRISLRRGSELKGEGKLN